MQMAEHAEIAILGAHLRDGQIAHEYCVGLRPEMFALASHRELYDLFQGMCADGREIDFVTALTALKDRGRLDAIGGTPYLSHLEDGIPRNLHLENYVATVIEKWRMREVQRIGTEFAERAAQAMDSSSDLLAGMQGQVLEALSEHSQTDDPWVGAHSTAAINRFIDRAKASPHESSGMSYGHTGLDELTDGMMPGQVTVIGARSGVGKSSIMLQACRLNARAGKPVHIFSLEMTRDQCFERLWSMESGVRFKHVRKPALASMAEIEAVKQAAYRVRDWEMRIHDRSDLEINQILALARLSIRRHGTQLVCVDYAQNVEGEGRDERTRVAAVSRKLTKLAKDEGVHMMLLSQLRKIPPEMYSKPPHVGDLRETGQIENDAHVVALLHRPWNEELARIADDGEIIVPKNREGDTGARQAKFNRNTLTFE